MYAQVTLLTDSVDPADYQSNGFAVQGDTASTTDLDTWAGAIKDFYDNVLFIGGCLGLAQNNHIVKFYTIGAGPPNYPVYETTFNFDTNPGDIQMPMEVALCISYSNTTENTVPRARRRGRIYLSGWSESFNDAGRPVEANLSTLVGYYATYAGDVNAISGLTAGIWSRVNDVVYQIDTAWVDNEWDTQRRRGGKASERQTVTF